MRRNGGFPAQDLVHQRPRYSRQSDDEGRWQSLLLSRRGLRKILLLEQEADEVHSRLPRFPSNRCGRSHERKQSHLHTHLQKGLFWYHLVWIRLPVPPLSCSFWFLLRLPDSNRILSHEIPFERGRGYAFLNHNHSRWFLWNLCFSTDRRYRPLPWKAPSKAFCPQ